MTGNRFGKRTAGWILASAALVFGPAVGAHAQATQRRLTGHVADTDGGAPIPAATVLVNGTTIGTTTSDSGTFTFRSVPAGAVTFTVRRLGYRVVTATVTPTESEVAVQITREYAAAR